MNPLASCGPIAMLFALQVPALWSPLNQTLPERLAGIIVVVEP